MATKSWQLLLILVPLLPLMTESLPQQGKWDQMLNNSYPMYGVHKSLFKGSTVVLKIHCNAPDAPHMDIGIRWLIRKTPCWQEYATLDYEDDLTRRRSWETYLTSPESKPLELDYPPPYYANMTEEDRCDSTILLKTYEATQESQGVKDVKHQTAVIAASPDRDPKEISLLQDKKTSKPVLVIPEDGVYLLVVYMEPRVAASFDANVHIEMQSEHGYLSAEDWPLLNFYMVMCIVYVAVSFIWTILCAMHWRDLLRVQMWISAVVFLGMIEMAVFYAEYSSLNSSGVSTTSAMLLAEIVSCAKRTLARLLVVVVSLGFGIVKPRLGETMHRVVAVGLLYFVVASTEASLRILHTVNGPSNRAMASIVLTVIDAGICWWIFSALQGTSRALRLRRNHIKLSLYRSFTNTLIFAVILSVGFMIWSISFIKRTDCLSNWKDIWIDEAFWHALFSAILVIIMALWRPTNNNQRYSFSPLMDAADDDEEDLVVNVAFGNMKLRQSKGNSENPQKSRISNSEEELRWIEDNVPNDMSAGDLPVLDSDEELISSKFELSKMQ